MGGIIELFNKAGFRGMDILEKGPSTQKDTRTLAGYVREIRADLPPIASLPKPIQDFIGHVKGLPVTERMGLIHSFVNANVKYDEAKRLKDIKDGHVSMNYAEVIKNYTRGDCDNHAALEIALLRYTGTKTEDLTWLAGRFKYTGKDGMEIANGMHNTAVLKVGERHYLLDMNLERPVLLENGHKLTGQLAKEMAGQGLIESVFGARFAGFLGAKRDPDVNVEIVPSMLVPLTGSLQAYDFGVVRTLGVHGGGLSKGFSGPILAPAGGKAL